MSYVEQYKAALQRCERCSNIDTEQNCRGCEYIGVVLYGRCKECDTTWDMWKYREEQEKGLCPNGCGQTLEPISKKQAEEAYKMCKEAGCFDGS